MSSFTFRELPRDDDGIIIGMWRVRHKTPCFEGGLGGAIAVNFVKGVADRPLGGGDLYRLMSAMGDDLTCEPWEGEVAKPPADTRRRARGIGPASAESKMTRQERESLREDRQRATAAAAVADNERLAQFSGLVPPTPADARAEISRLREPVVDPDEKRPNIIPDTEPAKKATLMAADATTVVEAQELNDNQRAMIEMLDDAGDDVGTLRELAEEAGVKVDRRWASERLRNEIQAAVQSADTIAPPGDGPDGLDGIEDLDVLRSIAEGLGVEADDFESADSLRTEIRRAQADVDSV